MTVVGQQRGNEIRPYLTEDGSAELLFLHYGIRGPSEIFHSEHAQNKMQTWIYRMAGWFIAFLGLNCLSSVLDIIGKKSWKVCILHIADGNIMYH